MELQSHATFHLEIYMHYLYRTPLAIAAVSLLLLSTACSDDDQDQAPGDPDDFAQDYCEAFVDCFDDLDDDDLDKCVDEMVDDYDYFENEFGTDCLHAMFETDDCLSQRSCDELRDNEGCSAEFEQETELCTSD